MKKILSVLCIVTLIFSTQQSTAFADEIVANQNLATSSTSSFDSMKTQAKEYRQQLIDNRDANVELRKTNKGLRSEIRSQLSRLKADNVPISETSLIQLKEYKNRLKNETTLLKKTKGAIKNTLIEHRKNWDSVNYNELKNTYIKINSIQENRNQQLQTINTLLIEIKDFVSTL